MTKTDFIANAIKACEVLLTARVSDVEEPGGSGRDSLRMRVGDRPVITTHRSKSVRSYLEVNVLRALHAHGAPVPRILAFDGTWLNQEDLGACRLSQMLSGVSRSEGETWLARALDGLGATHRAGRADGMKTRVARIGEALDWRRELVAMPARLSRHLGLSAPPLAEQALAEFIRIREPWLIKWDARPGNAIARDDGTVTWFDWEHCGARNRLDDVAWLLCDEFIADWPTVEEALLNRYLRRFDDGVEPDSASTYLSIFGTFHICVRLGLILDYKEDGPWWSLKDCLENDRAGVTRDAAHGLCARAARWASRASLTHALVPWFETVDRRLDEL